MVCLLSHDCLGDQIALSGAIVELMKRHGQIGVYCRPEYEVELKSFYYFHPEVYLFPRIRNEGPTLLCGHHSTDGAREGEGFVQWFYRQLDVPYEKRWNSCPIGLVASRFPRKRRVPAGKYIFLHDDPSRGQVIDRSRLPKGVPVYSPTVPFTDSILQDVGLIENAAEVHCLHSSYYWLTESVCPKGRLFLHRYLRPWSWYGDPAQHTWTSFD